MPGIGLKNAFAMAGIFLDQYRTEKPIDRIRIMFGWGSIKIVDDQTGEEIFFARWD